MASGGIVASNPTVPGATYTYASEPRVVQQRKKFKDDREGEKSESFGYGNIMYDRRIVRGNTYALNTLPASSQPDPLELQRQQEVRRRAIARKKAREQMRVRTPDAVDGRKHTEVQTELYLEEITDRVTEGDTTTQTDAFLDRPPTPLFIPAKTGKDICTQIEEGDLFDFDVEVKPILEVLVGKTVEQSLLEVMEEEELASLRRQQREFEERRNAELVEVQRLEEQQRRRTEEKERRMGQQREALAKEKETSEKVAARAFAQGYLSDLVPSVFTNLSRHGFFYDTVEREIESNFIPWLMNQVKESVSKQLVARAILDGMLKDILKRNLGLEESKSSDSQLSSSSLQPPEKAGETSEGQQDTAQSTQDPGEQDRVFGQTSGQATQEDKQPEQPKPSEQQEEPKLSEQQEEPKLSEQQEEPKQSEQQEEPKQFEQQEEPKQSEQQEEPKQSEQQEEPKQSEQQEESKQPEKQEPENRDENQEDKEPPAEPSQEDTPQDDSLADHPSPPEPSAIEDPDQQPQADGEEPGDGGDGTGEGPDQEEGGSGEVPSEVEPQP